MIDISLTAPMAVLVAPIKQVTIDLLMQQPVPESSVSLNIPIAVLVAGFIAATTIGSIAWYNSKRPPGWEAKERPDFVPKVDKDDLIADVSESKKK
jgi:hypothetical protein